MYTTHSLTTLVEVLGKLIDNYLPNTSAECKTMEKPL